MALLRLELKGCFSDPKVRATSPPGAEDEFVRSLRYCTRLRFLDLSCNLLGPGSSEGLQIVLPELMHLREIHLDGNQLGDTGMQHVADGIAGLQTISRGNK